MGASAPPPKSIEQERRSRRAAALRSVVDMNSIDFVTLEVADITAAQHFSDAAFGLGDRVRFRASDAPTTGFRGYTLSITVAQPADALGFYDSAVTAGATVLKPAAKSMWGFGGVVQAPDGTIWNLATSSKKDTGPATRDIESVVILLGVEDVGASRKFYVEQGLTVGKSFGSYVDFDMPSSPISLGLYKRRALAKSAGVPSEGSGSHRIVIGGDNGTVTDPDGFAWEPSEVAASA
jgi:uncharacterized glyoxalase superfamily protein PhnB